MRNPLGLWQPAPLKEMKKRHKQRQIRFAACGFLTFFSIDL
jgi:hypothetical protein